MIGSLLESLEPLRIPEPIMAEAYEKTPPKCRGAIKTAIALTAFYFHPRQDDISARRASQNLGFTTELDSCPCPAAFLIFPGKIRGAARICAAAALAALSGVGQILAIAIDATPESGILATLELCGVEDIFTVCASRLPEITACFSPAAPAIHIAAGNSPDFAAPWLGTALSSDFFYFSPVPKIALLSPSSFDAEVMQFCHGEAASLAIPPQNGWCDAIFLDPRAVERPKDLKAGLLLEPGCEGFWLFPRLGPEFFQVRSRSFAPLSESRPPFSGSGAQPF